MFNSAILLLYSPKICIGKNSEGFMIHLVLNFDCINPERGSDSNNLLVEHDI